ncbi:MAG: methyltransferase domain-containing protein [Anaerolineae bacterium]|nr:methyltransferase domain-containing protein [Anaerolineae bacterium]
MPILTLKPGREKSILQRHPWIFSGAVADVKGEPESGETVEILSARGQWLARAAYSPVSNIRARIWSWDEDETIGEEFFYKKVKDAVETRRELKDLSGLTAYRLVHAESDGLPGVTADRYADFLVVQFLTAGAEHWRETIVCAFLEVTGIRNIYERSDVDVRQLEGLGVRSGVLFGDRPPEQLEIIENGLRFWVDLCNGQKTGFYLDQRNNRKRVRELMSGKRLLNCFCYTGAFSVSALAGSALKTTSIDSSRNALALAEKNVALNGLPAERAHWEEADVFRAMRALRDRAETFDAVILDPPKFAPTIAQAEKAARAYKDINLLAFKLLRPGGLLFTFSCSGGISMELFQKIVADAALDAGVNACVLERLFQGADHPVALNFPEGAYLKGLICQKH